MNRVTPIPWRRGAHFSTGRDALCALLADMCAQPAAARPVSRHLWLPGYYCPDVVRTLLSLAPALRMELRTYPAPPPGPPDLARIPLAPGDLLLLVNLFGLQGASTTPRLAPGGSVALLAPGASAAPLAAGASPAPAQAPPAADGGRRFAPGAPPPGVILIEDHTHDPLSLWARTSNADWCFASLRKTLPLPDGGVVWSPGGRTLPRPPALTLQRRLASLEMLAAMTLRGARASGGGVAPETIRELEFKAEARLQSGAVSGMPPWTREMLEGLDVAQLRERRLAAHEQLGAALEAAAHLSAGAEPRRPSMAPGVRLLRPAIGRTGPEADPADACPYPAVFWFARPAARERARRLLEGAGVETLVLWPLEEQGPPGILAAEELQFSERMLAVIRMEEGPAQRGPGEVAALTSLLRDAAAAGAAEPL